MAKLKGYINIVLFIVLCIPLHVIGQENTIEKLRVTANEKFKSYISNNSYCLDNLYADSSGKLWFSMCAASSFSSSGLVYFDGYKFTDPKIEHPQLTAMQKNYIGISDDKIYGYSNTEDKSYLYFFDVHKHSITIYDSISLNRNENLGLKNDLTIKERRVFQTLNEELLYTYISHNNSEIELRIYNRALNTSKAKRTKDIPSDLITTKALNTYNSYYFGIDPASNEFIAYDFIQGVFLDVSIPIDQIDPNNAIEFAIKADTFMVYEMLENSIITHYYKINNPTDVKYLYSQQSHKFKFGNFLDDKNNYMYAGVANCSLPMVFRSILPRWLH